MQFSYSLPWWIAALGLAVVAVIIIFTYRRIDKPLSRRLKATLIALRVASVGLLLICLLEPTLIAREELHRKANLLVLVDDSQSMSLTDQAFEKSLRESSRARDIYYYDLISGRTERVSTSPLDEFGPAWSPLGFGNAGESSPGVKRALVYCRAEGGHAQLWIVSFDNDGKTVERQLTTYGGRDPSWSPAGDKIIYENNVQLWTIKPDGSDESPIIVDGEPVFGMDPFWTH